MSDSDMIPDQSTATIHKSLTNSRSFSYPPVAGKIVVIAVDASAHSKLAFNWYINTIHRNEDLVVLTHIPEVPDLPLFSFKEGLSVPVQEWTSTIQSQIEKMQALVNDYQDEMVTRKIRFKLAGSASTHPGPSIVQISQVEKADMIVVGSRGLDIIRRSLLGSVSDYVVRHANVPVLVCPNVMRKKQASK